MPALTTKVIDNRGERMNTCCWVLATGKACGEKVAWTMVPDGGEPGAPLVRKYKPFCAPHQAVQDDRAMRDDTDDDAEIDF